MEDGARTFWMNLFGSPIALVSFFVSSESRSLSSWPLNANMISAVVISCILGAGISYTAWGLRRRASAVTFSLVGVMCKIGSMVLNFFFLVHLSPESLFIIALGIVSTYFFEQAPERSTSAGLSERMPQPRVNKWLIFLFVIILIAGTAQRIRLQDGGSQMESVTAAGTTSDQPPAATSRDCSTKFQGPSCSCRTSTCPACRCS